MKTSCFVQTLGVLALLALSSQSFAQTTAASDPVGFVSVVVPANSDALLAVPLNRAAVFKGVIQQISGSTITVAGTSPGWTVNQFVQSLPTQTNTFALQVASGTKEGLTAKITANAANSVTIELDAGDDLTGIKTEAVDGVGMGDHLDILPFWTPGTLISSPTDGTELYNYFNTAGAPGTGVNLSPATLIVFSAGAGQWVDQITEEDVSHVPLKFGSAVLVRNNGAQQTFTVAGSVPMTSHRFLLRTLAGSTDQDLRIGYSSPVVETVAGLGFPAQTGDQIFIYNNSASGKNKSPAKILVYAGSNWVDSVTEESEDSYQIQPGSGLIFRKFRSASPAVAVWQDTQSYLAP